MKKMLKRVLPTALALSLCLTALPITALADSSKVVTLGANLTDEQKQDMYNYFGTSADQVSTITVTNADERKYMEGIASEAQIGTKTFSCSYVEPTEEGGIQVKVANLTFVTSSMIASTLLTSGVENCNVVAASPIAVSGTGALTGIMMAYESASGEELNEDQKETAMEELITTGELADEIGTETATNIMNDVKEDVIENNLSTDEEIEQSIKDACEKEGITLTDEQLQAIMDLMHKISQYDYDVNALQSTINNLQGKLDAGKGFFDKIKSFFSSKADEAGGIINNTDDSILGDNAVIDSTLDSLGEKAMDAANSEQGQSILAKIKAFFDSL